MSGCSHNPPLKQTELSRKPIEGVPREWGNRNLVLFEQVLEKASRSWGLGLDWTMHKEIDSCPLTEPTIEGLGPFG